MAESIHLGNKERGFYDEKHEIGTYIALVHSELSEALEADRKGRHADMKAFTEGLAKEGADFKEVFKANVKDTFEDEIADTFIRLFDICGYLNLDIESHIKAKLEYNATRGYKHGKNY